MTKYYYFKFEKLVRDNTLDIMCPSGSTLFYKNVYKEELVGALKRKLLEEAAEVSDAKNDEELLEELGDVLEVIHALANAKGYKIEDVEKAREAKKAVRGGFSKGIYISKAKISEDNKWYEYLRSKPEIYPELEEV